MKRRRMSAECEMDHSYAMPNIVSDLFLKSEELSIHYVYYITSFLLLERQFECSFEKNTKCLCQPSIKRHNPCCGWYTVSRSPLYVVHIQ